MADFQTENPLDLNVLKNYSHASLERIEKRLEKNQERLREWRMSSLEARSVQLKALARLLRSHVEEFSQLMALEMGKPIKQGRDEVEKSAVCAEHFAERLKVVLPPRLVELDGKRHSLVREPLGAIFAVMPWNFPVWQVIRSLVPIVAGGNTYVLKHAEIVAGTAELIEEICAECFGPGLVVNMHLTHDLAAHVIGDFRVRGVTMTGSSRGGAEIASVAGKHLKKCVLELGGSDAYVVLKDADVDAAAKICAESRMINSGQSCVAAKRFIVPTEHFHKFWQKFAEVMDKAVIGDPRDERTQIGPLAHRKFAEQLRTQQERLLKEGGKLLWQKDIKDLRGAFVKPAIIMAGPDQKSYSEEEFFGPIAMVTAYDDEEQAIELANHNRYGLGAAVFSSNLAHAENIAARLEAGVVAINGNVRSDPRLPFGGVKDSGFGRELGDLGLLEFQNHKTLLRL